MRESKQYRGDKCLFCLKLFVELYILLAISKHTFVVKELDQWKVQLFFPPTTDLQLMKNI